MATPVNSESPRGRDEIVDAALDAAERLFAAAGPGAVSLRDIAAEAGVTYSLVNRHLGTKAEIHERLLARYETRWEALTADGVSFAEAAAILLGDEVDTGLYIRLLAWSLLAPPDGAEEDSGAATHRRHSRLHELVPGAEQLGLPPEDAQARVATVLSLVLGWRFFAPFIVDVLHLDEADNPRLHDAIRRHLHALVTPPESG